MRIGIRILGIERIRVLISYCFFCFRIQTWALEEARRRLEVEGILKEPESK